MQAPELPPETEFRYSMIASTRWSDEDMQGVLNNAVYASLCEEARFAYFEHLGLLGADRHFPFVLLQSNLRFLSPGHGPARARVWLRTVHLGTRSFRQVYRMEDAASGQVWCEAEAVLVGWDAKTRGSTPLSESFKSKVAAFEEL